MSRSFLFYLYLASARLGRIYYSWLSHDADSGFSLGAIL